MEEGPEPHEWVEKSVEHHHEHEHGAGPDPVKRATTISAITAAILAVCAALGSLLSGHAANQAILKKTDAADQWAYFQSKSTKGHLYEVSGEVLKSLAGMQGGSVADSSVKNGLERFAKQVKKYEEQKLKIQHEAEELDAESKHEFRQHGSYALGVAAFQVGIVLASISIMIRQRAIWAGSLVAGATGIILLIVGLLTPHEAANRPSEESAHVARLL